MVINRDTTMVTMGIFMVTVIVIHGVYLLGISQVAIENGRRNSWFDPSKMVIFHSYVRLPGGTVLLKSSKHPRNWVGFGGDLFLRSTHSIGSPIVSSTFGSCKSSSKSFNCTKQKIYRWYMQVSRNRGTSSSHPLKKSDCPWNEPSSELGASPILGNQIMVNIHSVKALY